MVYIYIHTYQIILISYIKLNIISFFNWDIIQKGKSGFATGSRVLVSTTFPKHQRFLCFFDPSIFTMENRNKSGCPWGAKRRRQSRSKTQKQHMKQQPYPTVLTVWTGLNWWPTLPNEHEQGQMPTAAQSVGHDYRNDME